MQDKEGERAGSESVRKKPFGGIRKHILFAAKEKYLALYFLQIPSAELMFYRDVASWEVIYMEMLEPEYLSLRKRGFSHSFTFLCILSLPPPPPRVSLLLAFVKLVPELEHRSSLLSIFLVVPSDPSA